jgi:hypothetical protein
MFVRCALFEKREELCDKEGKVRQRSKGFYIELADAICQTESSMCSGSALLRPRNRRETVIHH